MTDKQNENINGYLVGNFSQYLNALDFKRHGLANGKHYLFILCTHPKVYQEIKKNLRKEEWDKVWVFYNRFLIFLSQQRLPFISGISSLLNEYWVYRKALKKAGRTDFEFFAVGNYFYPTYRSVSNQVTKNKTVVLDDGTNIILYFDYLISNNPRNFLRSSKWGSLLFKNLNGGYADSIVYFGTYRKLAFRTNDIVIFNERFGKAGSIRLLLDCAYIIGQPIYGESFSYEKYMTILESVINELNINKVLYVPHRLETEENINIIKQKFEILSPGEPIETFISKQKASPEKIISYCSSALLNLKLMDLPSVTIYAIKSKDFILGAKGHILEKILQYHESEGIQIINK